jgi:hypothetical protein
MSVADGQLDDERALAVVRAFWREEVQGLRDRHDRERLRQNLAPIQNREIAKATGIPQSTLSDLLTAKRDVVPDWDRVGLIIGTLGGTSREWVPKWRRARAAYDSLGKSTAPGAEQRPRTEPVAEPSGKRRWVLMVAVPVVAIGVGA